jgi:hypothetical protein
MSSSRQTGVGGHCDLIEAAAGNGESRLSKSNQSAMAGSERFARCWLWSSTSGFRPQAVGDLLWPRRDGLVDLGRTD